GPGVGRALVVDFDGDEATVSHDLARLVVAADGCAELAQFVHDVGRLLTKGQVGHEIGRDHNTHAGRVHCCSPFAKAMALLAILMCDLWLLPRPQRGSSNHSSQPRHACSASSSVLLTRRT